MRKHILLVCYEKVLHLWRSNRCDLRDSIWETTEDERILPKWSKTFVLWSKYASASNPTTNYLPFDPCLKSAVIHYFFAKIYYFIIRRWARNTWISGSIRCVRTLPWMGRHHPGSTCSGAKKTKESVNQLQSFECDWAPKTKRWKQAANRHSSVIFPNGTYGIFDNIAEAVITWYLAIDLI